MTEDNAYESTSPSVSLPSAKILRLLVGRAPQTIAELTSAAGVTRTAVSEQLSTLQEQGLVSRETEPRAGRGRPCYRYAITSPAMRLFAQGGAAPLAVFLLIAAQQTLGEADLDTLLRRTANLFAEHYRSQLPEGSPSERLDAFLGILRAEGAVLEIEPLDEKSDELILHRRSCPFLAVDQGEGHACLLDEQLFSQVLERPVRRVRCRSKGEHCCCFAIPHA